ncbi:hypothetical protein ACFOLJ_10640 [Rugamonas sp. CCM 8940]|uniref:hypothetical protein n=1 Tax=Rugamonas sp. CCM 8940 TaxID=2765359 RepID=UPI001F2D71FF|nr:hypothetical protein [Rugamonas sp. CCM 8940]
MLGFINDSQKERMNVPAGSCRLYRMTGKNSMRMVWPVALGQIHFIVVLLNFQVYNFLLINMLFFIIFHCGCGRPARGAAARSGRQ